MLSPNTPDDTNPSNGITSDYSMNSLLVSIAYDELELANAIYAEAEKIKSILEMLRGQDKNKPALSAKDLIAINRSVEQRIKDIIKEEIFLQSKLENALVIPSEIDSVKKCLY